MNPVKSMSGTMWAALLRLRKCEYQEEPRPQRTMDALCARGMADYALLDFEDPVGLREYCITSLGKMVADAYAEGQEAKA